MKLSQLYCLKFKEARKYMKTRKLTQDWTSRDHLSFLANEAEREASSLAHCIARFGDMQLKQFLDECEATTRRLRGGKSNPWRKGAYVVRTWLERPNLSQESIWPSSAILSAADVKIDAGSRPCQTCPSCM